MHLQSSEIPFLELWPHLGKTTEKACLEALQTEMSPGASLGRSPWPGPVVRAGNVGQRREAAACPLRGAWRRLCEVYLGALQANVFD